MFFYQSSEVVFLLKDWNVMKIGPYIAWLIASFLFGLLWEIVTYGIQGMK